ncbi:hypothetical protein KFE25_012697 [Diacronema lutheri]|uniref:Alpha-ketoglutarate-dependent dioxygenase AlkB-like domain-containing protein n=2 Tax=Diacronema lutheri TaxID=2081491 RepID=A0A8J5X6Q1_DIALT|nr:hypothetical protein KFE25_012697 [Diacronema lutheri]
MAAGRLTLVIPAPGSRPPPVRVLADVITREEEASLASQLGPLLRRRGYMRSHFDGVIEGYRELERPLSWFDRANRAALGRVLDAAFGSKPPPLLPAHVLELAPGVDGFIRPHVDHVGVSGACIAGLSLLSDAVMLLTHAAEPGRSVRLLLRARSLYVLRDEARYEWKHAILPDLRLFPRELRAAPARPAPAEPDDKARRIAVVFRDEPPGRPGVA